MKHYLLVSLLGLFVMVAGSATASTTSKADDNTNSHVIPVLVKVNSKGVVTDVDPAYDLRPALKRALKDALSKMITTPAMRKGVPVDSQFVVNLALETQPQGNDKSSASFKYISTKPLPTGNSWHWVRGHQNRLALANGSSQIDVLSRESARQSRIPPNTAPSNRRPPNQGNSGGGGNSGGTH